MGRVSPWEAAPADGRFALNDVGAASNAFTPLGGPLLQRGKGRGDHAPNGHPFERVVPDIVEERGAQSGQAHLVDADSAGQGVAGEQAHQLLPAHDDACLRAAQELIA